jgi:hypothetical protein
MFYQTPTRARAWLLLLGLAAAGGQAAGCVKKPTMALDHAEITGVSIAFPPRVGVLMTLYVDVYNPNSYDIAVRAVRGQVLLGGRYTLPVDFQAEGGGVWLVSGATTPVAVPVDIPVNVAVAVLEQSYAAPTIPYHFTGSADVTATRTFQIEKDDYSLSDDGWVSRQQIESAVHGLR